MARFFHHSSVCDQLKITMASKLSVLEILESFGWKAKQEIKIFHYSVFNNLENQILCLKRDEDW